MLLVCFFFCWVYYNLDKIHMKNKGLLNNHLFKKIQLTPLSSETTVARAISHFAILPPPLLLLYVR